MAEDVRFIFPCVSDIAMVNIPSGSPSGLEDDPTDQFSGFVER
jgi:hypothetical protein